MNAARRLALGLSLLLLLSPLPAGAAPVDLSHAGGAIAFTFNAGYASHVEAASILHARGMHATFYVVSSQLRVGPYYTAYMSASDLVNLSGDDHEIGSMTVTQVDLTTVGAARLESELADSQAALERIVGKPVRHLAYPYGAVNDAVAAAAARYYDTGRTLTTSTGAFTPTVDSHRVPGLLVVRATSLATAQSYVDFAATNGVHVVLSFERITDAPGTYDWTPAQLDALAQYVASKGVAVVTMSQVFSEPPPPPSPPSAPTLAAASGTGRVNLTWTVPAHNGAAIIGYNVSRATGSGALSQIATLGAQTAYADLNVTNGVTYRYVVTARNAAGTSPPSNEATATPVATPSAPGAPSLSVTGGSGNVTLAWTTPPTGGSAITGYEIHRGLAPGAQTFYRSVGPSDGFLDTNVTGGTTYWYRVRALNAVGPGNFSNDAGATPTQPDVPGGARVVFTFDDNPPAHVTTAQALQAHGFRGTFYLVSNCARSEVGPPCLTTTQIQSIAAGGHEIGSHSQRHPDLTTVSNARLTRELRDSQATLRSLTGQAVANFAYPYGAHDARVRGATDNYYATGRIYLTDPNPADLATIYAQSGADRYLVPGIGVVQATTLTEAKLYVEFAIEHNVTVVLTFHDVVSSGGDEYSWRTADFAALLEYTRSRQVPVVTMAEAYG